MNYYEGRKSKLLANFDRRALLMQNYLSTRYGPKVADDLYRQTRQEYERIIPEIPHIQGIRARALNSFLIIAAQELAVYRTMTRHGKTPGEAWEICHQAIKLRMMEFPRLKRWLLKHLMFSSVLMRIVKRRAEKGQQLKVGDFEVRYLVGDGKEFDWGVDYVACGNYNFLKSQGAEEFAPYVCMSDIALGNALGWGLVRTQTIADGCQSCNFRFRKGSKTMISSRTPEVQETIERIRRMEDSRK